MARNLLFVASLAVLGIGALEAYAQNCIVPAPPVPPRANKLVVEMPADGGTSGCTAYGLSGVSLAIVASPTIVPISAAKCAQARTIADQSVANDNGWNDGGVP